jgi:hypothetical protein
MGRYAQARRRGRPIPKAGLGAPPVPTIRVEGDDLILELGWTTAATTPFEIWAASDGVNFTLEITDSISQDEQGWVQEWAILGLIDVTVKFKVYGDGVQYASGLWTWSNLAQTGGE